MIPDLALVAACRTTYELVAPPELPGGVVMHVTDIADYRVVAFRGSVTAEDWARDFLCAPIVDRYHPELGPCHAGFLDGAEVAAGPALLAINGRKAIITGHSLGGALALGVGALLTLAKEPPNAIVTFGAPKFGADRFVTTLLGVPVRQYRRGNDPVPIVPFDVPPVLRWLDARVPLIQIGTAQRDPFRCHSIDGYVTDVAHQSNTN